MWQRGEIDALKIGLTLDYYWGAITPLVFKKYVEAYSERKRDEIYQRDLSNWQLGQYIGAAVGDILRKEGSPAKYPKRPVFSPDPNSTLKRVYTKEETEAFLRERKSDGE